MHKSLNQRFMSGVREIDRVASACSTFLVVGDAPSATRWLVVSDRNCSSMYMAHDVLRVQPRWPARRSFSSS